MKKWEYNTITNKTIIKDEVLILCGKNGWELISLIHDGLQYIYMFKKETK